MSTRKKMPNPMSGAVVTAMIRANIAASEDPNRKRSSADSTGLGSSVATILASARPRLEELRVARQITVPTQLSYSWLLFDDLNFLWTTDNQFTTPVYANLSLNLTSQQWTTLVGYQYECVYCGGFWLLFDQINKRILRGSDDLRTWTTVSGISLGTYYGTVTPSTTSGKVYVMSYGFLNISSDSGVTWTSKSIPEILTPDLMVHEGRLILTGVRGPSADLPLILVSSDDGSSWQTVFQGSSGDNLTSIVAIGSTLYATSRLNVYQSTDNGTTWTAYSHPLYVWADVKYTGAYYIASNHFDPPVATGPVWSSSVMGPWTAATTTDGSTLGAVDFVKRSLHYSGSSFMFRDHAANQLFKSVDGKSWSKIAHPVAGRKFVAGYPRILDTTRNRL